MISQENNVDYSLLEKDQAINILAVEDDLLSMNFLESQINTLGHKIIKAEDGEKALRLLEEKSHMIDVVLMDREMPVMDGLTAVKMMKDKRVLRNIPVVMVTGAGSVDEMKQGLDAGVFYYLTKPVQEDMLRSVLSAAIRSSYQAKTLAQELTKHRSSFNLIDTCQFKFQTLDEAKSLAAFMANCFADSERVLSGLGEILMNAVEHGNLGIGYQKKAKYLEKGTWQNEVDRRLALPEYQDRKATATISHKEDGTYVVVEDQGTGFDWKKFMHIDPSRAGDTHGRGIAQANAMSFDKLIFNDVGNQAIAFVSHTKKLEW